MAVKNSFMKCVIRVLRADRDEANTSSATKHAHEERRRTHHRGSCVRSGRPEDWTVDIASRSICRQSLCYCILLFFHVRLFSAHISLTLINFCVISGLTGEQLRPWHTVDRELSRVTHLGVGLGRDILVKFAQRCEFTQQNY